MLIKFKKNAFVFAIFGVALMIVYAVLLSFNLLHGRAFSSNDSFKIALLIEIPWSIYFIIRPNKFNTIVMLILAALSFNVFFFISAIFILVEKSNQEKLKEQERINNEINEFLVIEKKKAPPHIEYTEREKNQMIASIAIASIYLGLYFLLLFFKRDFFKECMNNVPTLEGMVESAGPAALAIVLIFIFWLLVWLLYFLLIVGIPLLIIIVFLLNIIATTVALNKKTLKSIKFMRVMGLLSLTIINFIVANKMLKRIE